jgi:hypothetical protein
MVGLCFYIKGLNWTKLSIFTTGIYWETPLNIDFEITNERQDCTMNTVCEEYFGEERGWMEEIKVREYGWCISDTYMK